MNSRLREYLERFFRVYQNSVGEVLQNRLSPIPGVIVEKELDKEFDLFKASIPNRLAEDHLL